MGKAEQSIQHVCAVSQKSSKQDTGEKGPDELTPYYETLLPENLGTHCRKWPAGKNKPMQEYTCSSMPTASHTTS